MPARLRNLLMLGTAAAATACAGNPNPQPLTPTQQFAIQVRNTPEEVAIVPSPAGISHQQADALRQVASSWADSGGDPVVIRVPAGDPEIVEPSVRATVDALVSFGVAPQMVRLERYDGGRGGAPILVGYTRFAAVGPECSATWGRVDATFDSRTSSNFGCAVTANIAAQIANPRDLLRPRTETPADATRRQAQLGQYRAGQPTGATRGTDEQAQLRQQVRQ